MWQPIDTAPKDGTWVDLWARRETTGEFHRHTDCLWGRRHFGSEPYGEPTWLGLPDRHSKVTPTHWMHLPAPPQPIDETLTEEATE